MAFIDIESLNMKGEPVLRILPEPKEKEYAYFRDGAEQVSFECPFDHTSMDVSHLFTALMLPERKFVRWRKKKMLVRKIYHRAAIQMNVKFDLPHVLKKNLTTQIN